MTSAIELSRTQGDTIFYGGVATMVIGAIVAGALFVIARHGNIPKLNYAGIGAFGVGLGAGTTGVMLRCFQKDKTQGQTANETALQQQIAQKEHDLQEARQKNTVLEGQLGEVKGNLQHANAATQQAVEDAKHPLLQALQKLTQERNKAVTDFNGREKHVQELTAQLEAAQKQAQDLIPKLDQANKYGLQMKRQYDSATQELDVLKNTSEQKIQTLTNQYEAQKNTSEQLKKDLDAEKAQHNAQQIQQLKEELAKTQEALQKEKDEGATLLVKEGKEKGAAIEANKKLTAGLEELKEEIAELEDQLREAEKRAKQNYDVAEDEKAHLEQAKETIAQLEAHIEDLQKQLNDQNSATPPSPQKSQTTPPAPTRSTPGQNPNNNNNDSNP